jgi:DNA-binding transcriptional LysR family regulator
MELRHFRYFVGVAEELHFGRAATRLGISQPPLSQQIRALEQELGVALFERTSRRVVLTAAGRQFLAEARKTLDQAAHAADVARRAGQGEMGELTIGFSTSAPFTAIVSQAVFVFRETHPAVHLVLREMPRGEQIEALVEQRIDVGFLRGVESPPSLPPPLVTTLLLEEPLLVAMHADHPLAHGNRPVRIEQLASEPFVLYQREHGAGFNEHLRMLCHKAGFEPRVVQEASGISTLLGLVGGGLGLTVLTHSLGALHIDNVVHRPLDHPEAISRMWLARRAGMSGPCQNFLRIVEEICSGTPAA